MAADHPSYRNQFIKSNALSCLLSLLRKEQNITIRRSILWTLTNLCRGHNLPENDYFTLCLDQFCHALINDVVVDKDAKSDLVWALGNLIEEKSDITKVIEHKIFHKVTQLALSDYHTLSMGAIHLVGNLSLGNIYETSQLVQWGVYDLAAKLLYFERKSVKRQVCWFLSNIVIGPAKNAEAFMAHNKLVQRVLYLFENDQPEVKRQICWVISNIGHSGNIEQAVIFIQQHQIMRIYIDILGSSQEEDLIESAVQSIGKMFQYGQRCKIHGINVILKAFDNCDGGSKLEMLQHHPCKIIYQRANGLIERYWKIEEENDVF